MAQTTYNSANKATDFQKKVNHEYVRKGRFGPYIGPTTDAIIQTNRNIKKASIALIAKLSGPGVSGGQTMTGNEEALLDYEFNFQPKHYRNAVKINTEDRELTEFDKFTEARPALMHWGMEHKRDMIIQAMGAIEAGGTYYNYGGAIGATGSSAASAANMDAWNTNNTDRILYGASKGNLTSGNHTASLATIDSSADKLTYRMVSLLKRMAKQANPLIRPVMLKGDEPWYVMFVGSYAFRDLEASLATIHQNAAPRSMKDNVLFTGGDLVYNGVIIKEVPEIDIFIDGDGSGSAWDGVWGANAAGDSLATAGDGSSRVGVGFFCGAQAVCFGRGKDASFARSKEDDYGFQHGIAIQMKHDFKKIFYNNKQHGMITSFHSAAADA